MQHANKIKIKLKHANTHATNQFAKQYHETCKKYTKQKIMKDKASKCNKESIKKLERETFYFISYSLKIFILVSALHPLNARWLYSRRGFGIVSQPTSTKLSGWI